MNRAGVAAFCILLVAGQAFGQVRITPPPPPIIQPRVTPPPPIAIQPRPEAMAAQEQAAINDLGNLVTPYQQVMLSAVGVIRDLEPHAQEAVALAQRHATPAEIRQWMNSWGPQVQAHLDAVVQAERALPVLDRARVSRIVAPFNATGHFDEAIMSYPTTCHQFVVSIQQIVGDVLRLAPATAQGDREAAKVLAGQMFESARVLVESQLVSYDIQMAGVGPSHPQYYYIKSMRSVASGVGELNGILSDVVQGKATDIDAVRTRLQTLVRQGREDAAQISPLSDQMVAQVTGAASAAEAPLLGRVTGAFATYSDSQRLILAVLDQLADVAATLGPGSQLASIDSHMEAINAMARQMSDVEVRRQAMLLN